MKISDRGNVSFEEAFSLLKQCPSLVTVIEFETDEEERQFNLFILLKNYSDTRIDFPPLKK